MVGNSDGDTRGERSFYLGKGGNGYRVKVCASWEVSRGLVVGMLELEAGSPRGGPGGGTAREVSQGR